MEICRCEEFKRILDEHKIYTLGTYHHLKERLPIPEGYYVKWIQCHPKILPIVPPDACDKPKKIVVESKWIPFSPNLISKKLVDEARRPNDNSPF